MKIEKFPPWVGLLGSVTRYCRPGSFRNRNLLLTFWKLEVQEQGGADSFRSSGAPLLGLVRAVCPCVLTGEVLTWSSLGLCVCLYLDFLFHKDTSHVGLGFPTVPFLYNPIGSGKTLSPNKVPRLGHQCHESKEEGHNQLRGDSFALKSFCAHQLQAPLPLMCFLGCTFWSVVLVFLRFRLLKVHVGCMI